jgi:hypothetical protein
VHRLPTRLHPILRSGTSFVDGCQRREHLALRLGTSCIDGRLVCTPSCDQAPRLSTGANAVSTWPCGWAPRALTAGRSATGLATRCSQRCHPTRTVLRQSDWETVSPLDAILRRTRWFDVDPDSIQPVLTNWALSPGSWTLCSKAAGPSTARSRTPKNGDEEGSRSTALCTRTSLDGRRSLSHRLATLRTDQFKRHGGEPLVDLRVSPTTFPEDRTTPEGVVSWTATDSVDTPRPPDKVQTTVDTPVAQPCD